MPTEPETIAQAAARHLALGRQPVLLKHKSKAPAGGGEWQHRRYRPEEIPAVFLPDANLGLMLGAASGNLVDIDCDTREAATFAAAFLPRTEMIHGRPSAPLAHFWFIVDEPIDLRKFADPDGGQCLIEFRCSRGEKGFQTMIPPSIHPSGEQLAWVRDGEPARVSTRELLTIVNRIAAATLLARHFPKHGRRHEWALALAGALIRRGWSEEEAYQFVHEVARIGGSTNPEARAAVVRSTASKIAEGIDTTGIPRLIEIVGEKVVKKAAEWLGLDDGSAAITRAIEARLLPAPSAESAERKTLFGAAAGPSEAGTSAPSPSSASTSLDDGGGGNGIAATLIKSATMKWNLVHTSDGSAYALDGHRAISLSSRAFKTELVRLAWCMFGKPLADEMARGIISTLTAHALFTGDERAIALRVGEAGDATYLDLVDGGAVEIDAAGWRVVDRAPVAFRRASKALPLPVPVPGGKIDELRTLLNLPPGPEHDQAWILILSFLVGALRPTGPYPILALGGEQGAAKSTTSRMLRALVDPSTSPLRSEPREPRDLAVAAENSYVLAFDNLSHLPQWLSDALARLSTGGGFATRTLYEDKEEQTFDAQRPVILNAIAPVATRPDLLDRCLQVTLPTIEKRRRSTEKTLWARFEAAQPRILGALLDAIAHGIRRLPETHLEELPRMADHALFMVAAAPALGLDEAAVLGALHENAASAVAVALDSSPVAMALRAWAREQQLRQGEFSSLGKELSSSGLLADLAKLGDPKSPSWPRSGGALSGELRRLAPALRSVGIHVVIGRTETRRFVKITAPDALE